MEFEGWDNITKSFVIEMVATFIILYTIFINTIPGNKYATYFKIGKTNYTYGFVITGIVLVTALYIVTAIAFKTGISAGHMSPLVTIPAMVAPLGVLSVTFVKGIFLLLAQAIAAYTAYKMVFK